MHTTYNPSREIRVGNTAWMSKPIRDSDVRTFAEISGDRNPVHLMMRTLQRRLNGFLSKTENPYDLKICSVYIGSKLNGMRKDDFSVDDLRFDDVGQKNRDIP